MGIRQALVLIETVNRWRLAAARGDGLAADALREAELALEQFDAVRGYRRPARKPRKGKP